MSGMNVSNIIQELQLRHSRDWPDGLWTDAVTEWTGGSAEAECEVYDSVASELARGFDAGRYSFSFCDAVMNRLFGIFVQGQFREPAPPEPKIFMLVYDAFDAGEFHRLDDQSDDPVEEFTRPAIARIVRNL